MKKITTKRALQMSAFLSACLLGVAIWLYVTSRLPFTPPVPVPGLRFTRPYGMAPPAFYAYVRACHRAKIHPWRVGQTIGDYPLSVGYHHKDGTWWKHGEPFDYCAAVDLGTSDLSRQQIGVFIEEMAKQGFAAFYREGGKWKGREHIHAVYAMLPMKTQLRRQVREFLRERRKKRKPPLAWEKRWDVKPK